MLKDLIEYVAKSLVDNPDQVQVSEIEGEQTSVIELKVAKEDLGKVIGKQGRTARAMARAVCHLRRVPGLVRIDGNKAIPGQRLAGLVPLPRQETVVGGDLSVPAISAASIVAKTARDRLMTVFARRHPGYGFEAHKGYGVAVHLAALRHLGPCPIHRLTFRGVLPPDAAQMRLPGL